MSAVPLVEFGPISATERAAVPRALAACREPVRIERRDGAARLLVSERDATAARALWARCGLEPRSSEWPSLESASGGVVAAAGLWWCIGRASVANAWLFPHAVLVLRPVPAADAARAGAAALSPRPWQVLRATAPRPLAFACARALRGSDGVVCAGAFVLASGTSAGEARRGFDRQPVGMRLRPLRLRAGARSAWEEIASPGRGGVWRLVSDLADWWR